MQNKSTKILNFSGQNVYIGLDVHKDSWAVNIRVDNIEHRTFTQPPDPIVLYNYLIKNFPGANYFSAYECGFCGYHHHRKLQELGIHNIVINPADLPVTDKEKIIKYKSQKTIIKIAHKVLNRIRYVWLTEQPYQMGIV